MPVRIWPKGQKDTVKAHAQAQGESLNAFINRAINEAMERDSTATETAGVRRGLYHVAIADSYFSACSSSRSPEANQIIRGRHCDRLLFIYRGWLGDIRSRYMG